MTMLDTLTSSVGNFSWVSMGNITLVITLVTFIGLFFGAIAFFMWYKSFNYKVKIYEPIGQVNLTQQEIAMMARSAMEGKGFHSDKIKFDTMRIKKTVGRFMSEKGTPFFQTFMPMNKMRPVSMELIFNDGIHMLKIARGIMIPIPKPATVIEVSQNVSISVNDSSQWTLWNNLMAEKINAKYQDMDAQRKVILYVIAGLVCMTVIGALILYFIYKSVNKGINLADKFQSIANQFTANGGKVPA